MPSVHYTTTADPTQDPGRRGIAPERDPRPLTEAEEKAIRALSAAFTAALHRWIEEEDRHLPPDEEPYHFHNSAEDVEPTFDYGVSMWEPDEWTFFGFTNFDNIFTNVPLWDFLIEYLRELSVLVPDRWFLWGYDREWYFRDGQRYVYRPIKNVMEPRGYRRSRAVKTFLSLVGQS